MIKSRIEIAREAVKTATSLCELKLASAAPEMRKRVAVELHIKQFEDAEKRLTRTLVPFFRKQIQAVRKRLTELAGSDSTGQFVWNERAISNTARNLASVVYNPKDWDKELIDRALPALARSMGEAGQAQLILMGRDKTTGSEWLERNDEELPPGLSADVPPWMADAIEAQLQITFEQSYWTDINRETAKRIETFLNTGLSEGYSISRMASEINSAFPMEYSRTRATLVARTEAPNALNGARKLSIQKLREEVPDVPLKELWLSVLAATTRDAHAALHDVPADSEGLWDLNGVRVPWPGHWSLPAGDRCNCFCTIVTEIGD